MSPRSKGKTGINPLAYMGVNSPVPPDFTIQDRRPTIDDYIEFNVGDWWMNYGGNAFPPPPIIDLDEVFVLVKKINNNATWRPITGSLMELLEGNTGGPVPPDINDIIFVLGDVLNFTINGTPLTNTLEITTTSGNVLLQSLTGNTGGAVFPDINLNINLFSGSGFTTTGNPGTNTITVSLSGAAATTFVEDVGSATPVADILEVLGDASTITTTGAGNTITIASSITPSAFSAYLGASIPNFDGDDLFKKVPYDTIIFDINGDFSIVTSLFTAPLDGKYFFHMATSISQINGTGFDRYGIEIQDVPVTISIQNENFNPAPIRITTLNNGTWSGEMSALMNLDAGDVITFLSQAGNPPGNTNVLTLDGGTSPLVTTVCGYRVI